MKLRIITKKEYTDKITSQKKYTKQELSEMNKAPTHDELQASIKKDGIGYITYAKNHRDKK